MGRVGSRCTNEEGGKDEIVEGGYRKGNFVKAWSQAFWKEGGRPRYHGVRF